MSKVGMTGLYNEDGQRFFVECLEDNSDESFERYRFRVTRFEQGNLIYKDAEVGEEFDACRTRDPAWADICWSVEWAS